jgi:drug/metabolite transporter (DMT)-like permease
MTAVTFGLILLSVTISALAQICLKFGVMSPGVQQAIAGTGSMYPLATSPGLIGGLALYALGAVTWILVLSKTEVSQAYPFVGLSFVMTLFLDYFIFLGAISVWRVIGVGLIVLGVAIVGQS